MRGSTSRAALTGTLSRSVPAGRSRKLLTTSSDASTSVNATARRSKSRAPASVGATLRVERLSSRTASRVSTLRTASLKLEALEPVTRDASRKPPERTTATNAVRSVRSPAIVRLSAQPVPTAPYYRTRRCAVHFVSWHRQRRGPHDRYQQRRNAQARISHREAGGIWRHAARGPRSIRTAERSYRRVRRAAGSSRERRRSHRHERLLRSAHHQSAHPRSAASLYRKSGDRHQDRRQARS